MLALDQIKHYSYISKYQQQIKITFKQILLTIILKQELRNSDSNKRFAGFMAKL